MFPNEFSLIHFHGFLTALPRPRLGLILSCLALASSMLPYSHHCFQLQNSQSSAAFIRRFE